MDALIDALTSQLAGFDQALADPGVQRFPQMIFALLAVVAALLVLIGAYVSSSDDGGQRISLLAATKMHAGMCVACAALLLHVRRRWQRVKQLHGLLVAYTLCAAGALIHDLIGLHVGRTLYQTTLAILPICIVIFVFASFAYGRWMAWIAALFAACLLLFLVMPSHFLVWAASAAGTGWIVGLIAWRRLTREHGVAATRLQFSQRS